MTTGKLSFIAMLALACASRAADDYQPGPDSQPREGVPRGEVIKGAFDQSKIFPGTWREYWVFGGPDFDELYATCGDKVLKRKLTAKGVLSFQAPIKPGAPRL